MTKAVKLPKGATDLINRLEASGQLGTMNEYGSEFKAADKPKKKQRNTRKEPGCSSYKWYSGLKKQMNTSRPTQWFEEAENNGLMSGNGECAKRLRMLAKRDRRMGRNTTENREQVRKRLGDKWKHGIIGLAITGKPRGIKKSLPETIA